MVSKIEEDVGYIDVLINNSGIARNDAKGLPAAQDIKSFREQLWNAGTPEDFMMSLEVNVKALYYVTVAFLELLDAGNKTRICVDEPTS